MAVTESSQFMSDTAATLDPEVGGQGAVAEVQPSGNLNPEGPLSPAPEEALTSTSTTVLQNPNSTSDAEIRKDNSTSDDLD